MRDDHQFWYIEARIEMTKEEGGFVWNTTKQIPGFLLSSNQYGILTDRSASAIARAIIDPIRTFDENLIIRATMVP